MAAKAPKQQRPSHYRAPGDPGRWGFEAWTRRRAVKIYGGVVSDAAEVARRYREMSPRVYRRNAATRPFIERRPAGWGAMSLLRPER